MIPKTASVPVFTQTPKVVYNNPEIRKLLKPEPEDTPYTPEDITAIWTLLESKNALTFPTIAQRGLFCAALSEEGDENYTGYQNVWVRDNIYIAYAHLTTGQPKMAVAVVKDIVAFWSAHRRRFIDCINGRADPEDVMQRPHIRFNGHDLDENSETWSHAQNDAIGYFLWLTCMLGRKGLIDCCGDKIVDLLVLVSLYLDVVSYWDDKDNGHWEEVRKLQASSVGAVVAGMHELHLLLKESVEFSAAFGHAYAAALFFIIPKKSLHLPEDPLEFVEHTEARGRTALEAILPYESRDEGAERVTDGALLYLVYPLQVVEGDMARQIVQDVVNMLAGDYGIRRYTGDSYWMADYKTLFSEENRTADFSHDMSQRDKLLKPGEEAQWCIFDSIISAICGKWALTASSPEEKSEFIKMQSLFFDRAVGQVTGPDCAFGAYKCPESYYLEKGKYVVNDICPLLWTQANLLIALHYMKLTVGGAPPGEAPVNGHLN